MSIMFTTEIDHLNIEGELSPEVSPFKLDDCQSQVALLFRAETKKAVPRAFTFTVVKEDNTGE